MNVRNIMEDIVSAAVEEVLAKEKNLNNSQEYFEDICAYVLNRVPAKYITSERGILHGFLDTKFKFQEKSDILLLTYEAIGYVKARREESEPHIEIGKNSSMLYFPHLLGEIVEETTFSKIAGVKVTLLYNGEPMEMVTGGWSNPFITRTGTQSYYHFWPQYPKSCSSKDGCDLKIKFEHEHCITREQVITVKPYDNNARISSQAIPIVLLQLKPGADSSFLYNED